MRVDAALDARLADNPFPGLRSFQADEADVFFGRQQQIDELLVRLAEVPLIAVAGSSGCGKSSLVLAGLLNALKLGQGVGQALRWRPVVMRPGDSPITRLAKPLAAALVGDDPDPDAAADDDSRTRALAGRLHLGADALVQAVRRARLPPNERVLVVVDQFEEIFRYKRMTDPEECVAFVKLLLQAARVDDCPLKVVLTLRSDSLGSCADFRGLPEAVSRGQFLVPRLTRDQRKQAIVGPVEHRGFQIAPRLVQRVLNDVSDGFDDLPVMQHALACTWRRWAADTQGSRPLDLKDYENIGTSVNALSQHADEAYDSLPGLGAVVERVFRALTERLDAAGSEVRRPMHFTSLCQVTGDAAEQVAQVVERYRRADTVFLLPSASTPLADDPLIDIAHESLIRGWVKLTGWAEREALSAQSYYRIANAAKPVDGQAPAFLRDPGLQFALDWRKHNRPNAHWAALYDDGFEQAMAFLDHSKRERDAERASALRTSQRRKWIAAGVTLGSLALALVMGVLALQVRQSKIELLSQQDKEEKRGDSRKLALAAARHLSDGRIDVALMLGASALQEPAAEEAQEIMRKVLIDAPQLILRDPQAAPGEPESKVEFNSLRFSHTGDRLVAVYARGDVVAWDVAQGRQITAIQRTPAKEHDLTAVFDADGRLWVSPDASGQAGVVDAAGALTPLGITDLAASASDGFALGDQRGTALEAYNRWYARVDKGQGIRLWSLQTGALVAHLPEAADDAKRLQFSERGRRLAALEINHGVQIWDLGDSATPRRAALHIQSAAAANMALSRDGKRIAVVIARGSGGKSEAWDLTSSGSEVEVWDLERGVRTHQLKAQGSGTVDFLAFGAGASSSVLAWGQSDGVVMVWDLNGNANSSPPKEHTGIKGIAFSGDGCCLATGDRDGVIALWSVDLGKDPLQPKLQLQLDRRLKAWNAGVDRLAFSHDGRRLASAHRDGTVLVRAVTSSGVRHGEFFRVGVATMSALAFDPAGKRPLALASEDSTIQFWDLAKGRLLPGSLNAAKGQFRFKRADESVALTSIAYSPDGTMIASGSEDKKVRLWNLASGNVMGELAVHDDTVMAVAFNHNGSLLASVGEKSVVVSEVAPPHKVAWRNAQHHKEATAVAFNRDGSRLASADRDGTVFMWDAQSGRPIWAQQLDKTHLLALAFSPDERSLAVGAAGAIVFLNAADGAIAKPIVVVQGNVSSIAFDSLGKRLVSGASDGMVRLWDVTRREPIGQPFEGHLKLVNSVAFIADGKTVASVGADRRIMLWDADQPGWRARACAIVQQGAKLEAWPWPRNLRAKYNPRDVCAP